MTVSGPESGRSPTEPPRIAVRTSRQPRRLIGRDPLGVILVLLAVLWMGASIGGPLLGRTTFQADSVLDQGAPWEAAAPNHSPIYADCTTDTVDGVQPGRVEGVEDLRKGQITQLDPYVVGGVNSLFGQNAGLYDPVTFAAFTTLPFHVAPAYEKVLELVVIFLGMVLWMRRLGLSTAAGVIGGLLYGASGFMVAWTNWPQDSVACWIPMFFWAAERLAQRRSLSSALLLAIPFASMLLGGFPAVTGWTVMAIVVYLAMRLLMQDRPVQAVVRGTLVGAAGAVLGLGIAAFMLLPFASSYGAHSFGYRSAEGTKTLARDVITTTLFPNSYGNCAYLRGPAFFLGSYVESEMFVGSAAAVLILIAVTGRLRPGVPRGPRAFMVVMAAFVANQMLLHDPLQHFVADLPVFSSSPPGRLRCLFGLAAAVLGAMGVDRLVAGAWQPHWWRRRSTIVVALAWLLAALIAAYAALVTHRQDNLHHFGPHLLRGIIDSLAVAAVTAAVVLVAALFRQVRVPAVLVIALIVAVQSGSYVRGFWPRDPNSSYYPTTPTTTFLTDNLGTYRMSGDGTSFRTGVSTLYRLATPAGHTFATTEWVDLLKAVDPTVAKTVTYFQPTFSAASIRSPILDLMSVRYVVRGDDAVLLGDTTPALVGNGSTPLSGSTPVSASAGDAPLRGVGVTLATPLSVVGAPFAALHVDLVNSAGQDVSSGSRRVYNTLGAGVPFSIAVTDPGDTSQQLTARVSVVDDPNTTSVVTHDGAPALTLTTRPNDGLRIVQAQGSVIYERTTALPHVRWASTARVIPQGAQVAALSSGVPADQVVLTPGTAVAASGQPATVSVRTDGGTTVSTDVDAQGSGYLVVSTAFSDGWRATVDGKSAPIVDADHGMQAVAVPAGRHRVVLQYTAGGLRPGIAVTLVTLVAYVLLWAVIGRRCALRRRRGGNPRTAGADAPAQA